MFQPSKRIHSGFYRVQQNQQRSTHQAFQPSKRIHSGFYRNTATPGRLREPGFNPPRGFIPVSTRKRFPGITRPMELVSTLQEDSFRFLPRHHAPKYHEPIEFQPSKRIHSGFYWMTAPLYLRNATSFNPPRGFIPVSTPPSASHLHSIT